MKKKTLFRKVTALMCCITMLVTLMPSATVQAAGPPTLKPVTAVEINKLEDVVFYDQNREPVDSEDGSWGDNYYCDPDGDCIQFVGYDFDAEDSINLRGQTIVFYAKTPENKSIVIDAEKPTYVTINVEKDDSMAQWWKITVSITKSASGVVSLTAKLAEPQCNVIFSLANGCTVNVDGAPLYATTTKSYEKNSNVSFTVELDDPVKTQATVSVGGSPVSADSEGKYTVNVEKDNTKINIGVEPKQFTVKDPVSATGYKYSRSSSNKVNYNGSFTFSVEPASGYENPTVSIKGTGNLSGPIGNTYTINDITGDIEIEITAGSQNTYSIHLPDGGNEYSIELTGGNSFTYGAQATFTVKAKGGYQITAVRADGKLLTDNGGGSYSVTVNADVEITVETKKAFFDVTYDYEDSKAFSVTKGNPTAEFGSDYYFWVNPKEGFGAPRVFVNGTEIAPVSGTQYKTNIAGETTIKIEDGDRNTYNVSITPGNGYEAKLTSQASIAYGEKARFTVDPKPGYEITSVTAVVGGKAVTPTNEEGNKYSVEVTGDVTITITASKASYDVVYDYDKKSEAFTVLEGNSTAEYGDFYTFNVTTGKGYGAPVVTYKINDGATPNVAPGTNGQYTIKIEGKITIKIEAGEKDKFSVLMPSGAGFTAKLIGDTQVEYGNVAKFTVTPDPGYEITAVTAVVNGKVTEPTYKDGEYYVEVTGETSINVTAKKLSYTVTYSSTDDKLGVAYTMTAGESSVEHGNFCTFYVSPTAGYKDPVVTVAGKRIYPTDGSQYRVPITAETVINIEAGEIYKYNVTLVNSAGFTFTQKPADNDVAYGGSYTFEITVNEMYNADGLVVKVNGTDISATKNIDGTYSCTIENITENKTVTVTGLVKKTFLVTFANEGGYTLSTAGSMSVSAEDNFVFTLNVADSHEGTPVVKANGQIVDRENGTYTITIRQNTTITVEGLSLRTFTADITASGAEVEVLGKISYGNSCTFKVTANAGYRVTNVLVNGTIVAGAAGVYTVDNVTRNPQIIVQTVENALTVTYVSNEPNHQMPSETRFTLANIGDAIPESLSECAIHTFKWVDDNGNEITVEKLANMIKEADETVTLTAKFEISAEKIKELVALNQTSASVVNTPSATRKYTVVFKTVADVLANMSDSCVAQYVTVTGYGTLLSNKADANFEWVKDELETRERDLSKDHTAVRMQTAGSDIIFNYYRDCALKLEDVNNGYIGLNINTDNPGGLYAVGWMELYIAGQRVIIFSGVNEQITVE